MNKTKLGNSKQVISAYRLTFNDGPQAGKDAILVHNNELEVLFNVSNALDIVWVKYKGINISYLSKNGMNSKQGNFPDWFEGGFLYTCGLDNVNRCVPGLPVHGTFHFQNADNISIKTLDDSVIISGEVCDTGFFGRNLCLKREFVVKENEILINDTLVNNAFIDAGYAILYHINYGHPFLDECVKLEIPLLTSKGVTDYAESRKDKQLLITNPIAGGEEEVFINTISEGKVKLINPDLNLSSEIIYSLDDFPFTVEWKAMIVGDYALGIEPTTTRFDDFKYKIIKAQESKTYKLSIKIK